jgi:hypothetical protein
MVIVSPRYGARPQCLDTVRASGEARSLKIAERNAGRGRRVRRHRLICAGARRHVAVPVGTFEPCTEAVAMRRRSSVRKMTAFAVLVSGMCAGLSITGYAQVDPRTTPPERSAPGETQIQPPTTVPQPLSPTDRSDGSRTEPDTQLEPRWQQPHGGCRYREQPLELIV